MNGLDQQDQVAAVSGLDQQEQAAAVSQGVPVEPNKFYCHECGEGFEWKSDLMMHIYLHSREPYHPKPSKPSVPRRLPKQFECQECGNVFCLKPQFDKHVKLRICKRKLDRKKLCEVCGHMAKNQHALDEHLFGHTRVKNYKCEICGEEFITYGKLMIHTAIHTGEILHECQKCGKKFWFLATYRRHMIRHEKEGN